MTEDMYRTQSGRGKRQYPWHFEEFSQSPEPSVITLVQKEPLLVMGDYTTVKVMHEYGPIIIVPRKFPAGDIDYTKIICKSITVSLPQPIEKAVEYIQKYFGAPELTLSDFQVIGNVSEYQTKMLKGKVFDDNTELRDATEEELDKMRPGINNSYTKNL